jgi:hypothetical protein
MTFDIKKFNSEIGKSGFAIPAYFAVSINLPPQLSQKFPGNASSLPLRIESASLPDRMILTHDQRYYGPMRKIPYGFSTDKEFTISIIMSDDYRERHMFMAWQDLMVGKSRTPGSTHAQAVGQFDAGWYDDAVKSASIDIHVFSGHQPATVANQLASKVLTRKSIDPKVTEIVHALPGGIKDKLGLESEISPIHTVKLIEPFPILVSEQALNWADVGYAKLGVSFTYRYFTEENFSGSENNSLLDKALSLASKFKPVVSLLSNKGSISSAADSIRGAF